MCDIQILDNDWTETKLVIKKIDPIAQLLALV